MSRVRIGQVGWNRDVPADSIEDSKQSIHVAWVEIDGQRIDGVLRARVKARRGATTVRLDLCAAAEIVLVDDDGVPLPEAT